MPAPTLRGTLHKSRMEKDHLESAFIRCNIKVTGSLDMSVYHPEIVRSFRGLSEDQVLPGALRRNAMLQQLIASTISLTMPLQLEEL
ncbi:hypothetical protein NL676_028463 [Syzygium grande]|nr:hypothetical protein NL676_028463 [Syzygium grande]